MHGRALPARAAAGHGSLPTPLRSFLKAYFEGPEDMCSKAIKDKYYVENGPEQINIGRRERDAIAGAGCTTAGVDAAAASVIRCVATQLRAVHAHATGRTVFI